MYTIEEWVSKVYDCVIVGDVCHLKIHWSWSKAGKKDRENDWSTGRKWRPSLQSLSWSFLLDDNQEFQVYHGAYMCVCACTYTPTIIHTCVHTVSKQNQNTDNNNITTPPLQICLILACLEMHFCGEAKDVALSEWRSLRRTQGCREWQCRAMSLPLPPMELSLLLLQ